MLTLAGLFRIGSFTVYRDVVFSDGERSFTSNFYAMPDAPRLARDDSGGPAFHFLWYRALDQSASGAADVRAGGMLTVTVDLSPDAAEQESLRKGIAEALRLDNAGAVRLLPMPFESGTVSLLFAGESGAGEFAQKVAGQGPASLTGPERATFAVELSKDGAALLAKALDGRLDILRVSYDMVFEYRLDAIKLRVWCDARAANQTVASRLAVGSLEPAQLLELLETRHLAGIELSSETEIPPAQTATLENMAHRLLDSALAGAMFSFGDGSSASGDGAHGLVVDGKVGKLRPYAESSQAILNHTFSESYPAQQHALLAAVLRLEGSADELAARVLQVDVTDAMRPLHVSVACPVDFTDGPIGSVHLWIEYNAKAADGTPIDQSQDFVFRNGATQWVFRVNATADQRSYSYHATVFYTNGTTAELDQGSSDATVLVIEANSLGVLDVVATLGDVPLTAIRSVVVDLEYPPNGLTTTIVIDGVNSSRPWQAVVGTREVAPYRYRASWLTADGRRIEDSWRETTARRLFLDAPPGIGSTATVQAIAAGDFSGVGQLVLDLRVSSGAGAETAQFTFTHPGESLAWKPHSMSPGTFHYQARRTMVYQDGTTRALDWTDETTPVLVVSDLLRFNVQIVPRLLDLGGRWTLVLLDLEYANDSASVHNADSLVLRDRNAEPQWSFRMASPDRHRYRYRLMFVAKDGTRLTNPWQEAEDEVLVLHPQSESPKC